MTTAADIIKTLSSFIQAAQALSQMHAATQPAYTYTYNVSLSYAYITVTILESDPATTQQLTCMQISFEQKQNAILLTDIYRAERAVSKQIIETITAQLIQTSGDGKSNADWLSPDIKKYLLVADRIAEKGCNQYAGDDYRPGFYSKIEISEAAIILAQVNHMNSRSLNHKDNYSLRDLVFRIPLSNTASLPQHRYDDVYIGNMCISFSDRSADKNRAAGDAIQQQIQTETTKWPY